MLGEGKIFGIKDKIESLWALIKPTDWTVLIDVLIVAFIFYGGYLLIKETRALRILYGILMLAILYLMGQFLNLVALNFLLRSVFAVTLVAIPVVFQPELRAALERLGRRGDLVSTFLTPSKGIFESVIDDLLTATAALSEKKTGALIVIQRQTGLKDIADEGVMLDAKLTPELLLAIFNPKSPLHDGAVIVSTNRVLAASVFLPLSSDTKDHSIGSRHRAALGVTKETDALVIVVSEQTGRISLAFRGKIIRVDLPTLEKKLSFFLITQNV